MLKSFMSLVFLFFFTAQAIPIPLSHSSSIPVRPLISKAYHLFDKKSTFSIVNNQIAFIYNPALDSKEITMSQYSEDSKVDTTFRYDTQKGTVSVNGPNLVISLDSRTQAFKVIPVGDETASIFKISEDAKLGLSYNGFLEEKNYKLCQLEDSKPSSSSSLDKETIAYGLYSMDAQCADSNDFIIQLSLIDDECEIVLKSLEPDYLEVYDGSQGKIMYL